MQSSAIGWLVLAAACGLIWQLRRLRDGALNFAWLWTAGFIVPVANFVPVGNTPVAMHYLYLPGLGLALLNTRLVQRFVDGLRSQGYPRIAVLPALALGALILAWLPEQRKALGTWADATALYARTIQNYPSNVEARVNLAALYMDSGKHVEAEMMLTEALALAPDDPLVLANRFKLLAELGRIDEALAVQDAHPELNAPAMMFLRGTLLLRTQRDAEAAGAFRQAFGGAVEPEERFAAGYQLAIAHVRTEHYAEAEVLIDQLLGEFPGRPELLLGKQLLTQQRRVPSR
jgi:tetratricopeptide (TPR) repeat protein